MKTRITDYLAYAFLTVIALLLVATIAVAIYSAINGLWTPLVVCAAGGLVAGSLFVLAFRAWSGTSSKSRAAHCERPLDPRPPHDHRPAPTRQAHRQPDPHERPAVTTPRGAAALRTFELVRTEDETGVSGTGVVAYGVQFPDGTCVLRWDTLVNSTVFYNSVADLEAVHGHGGKTAIRYSERAYYRHPECGFRWNGLDVPLRDGEPVCPRCELEALRRGDQ